MNVRASRIGPRPLTWVWWIITWCAVLGFVAGQIWMWRWSPPSGQVIEHHWYPDPWDAGNRSLFAASGWFAAIALGGGAVTGVMALWLSRLVPGREVHTVIAVALGTVIAAVVMQQVGAVSSPPDPAAAAKTATDGTVLLGSVPWPGWGALACFPTAALLLITAWFLLRAPRPNPVGSPES